MRRLPVRYKPEAMDDLRSIYRYLAAASGSNSVAQAYVQRIMARCRRIGDVPNGGRPRNDLLEGLRTVPFEKAVVITYRVSNMVEILNVFYGGRDFEALYLGYGQNKESAPE